MRDSKSSPVKYSHSKQSHLQLRRKCAQPALKKKKKACGAGGGGAARAPETTTQAKKHPPLAAGRSKVHQIHEKRYFLW